ncbi:MAG: hypothetical protein ACRD2C_07150 [Acidimicrobiales bacterium]
MFDAVTALRADAVELAGMAQSTAEAARSAAGVGSDSAPRGPVATLAETVAPEVAPMVEPVTATVDRAIAPVAPVVGPTIVAVDRVVAPVMTPVHAATAPVLGTVVGPLAPVVAPVAATVDAVVMPVAIPLDTVVDPVADGALAMLATPNDALTSASPATTPPGLAPIAQVGSTDPASESSGLRSFSPAADRHWAGAVAPDASWTVGRAAPLADVPAPAQPDGSGTPAAPWSGSAGNSSRAGNSDSPDRANRAVAGSAAVTPSVTPAASAPLGARVVGASVNSGSRPSVTPD